MHASLDRGELFPAEAASASIVDEGSAVLIVNRRVATNAPQYTTGLDSGALP